MKRIISTILSIMVCLMSFPLNFVTESLVAEAAVSVVFAGSGTENDPYQISNASHLLMLAEYINSGNVEGQYELTRDAYYIQTADIDLKGKAWTPIGLYDDSKHYFAGHYNGNYYSINLKI